MKTKKNELGVPRSKAAGRSTASKSSPKKAPGFPPPPSREEQRRILKVKWSKKENDMMYHYSHSKTDGALAHYALGCERHSSLPHPHGEWMPSFFDELKARGYDLTTFRMVVMGPDVPHVTPSIP